MQSNLFKPFPQLWYCTQKHGSWKFRTLAAWRVLFACVGESLESTRWCIDPLQGSRGKWTQSEGARWVGCQTSITEFTSLDPKPQAPKPQPYILTAIEISNLRGWIEIKVPNYNLYCKPFSLQKPGSCSQPSALRFSCFVDWTWAAEAEFRVLSGRGADLKFTAACPASCQWYRSVPTEIFNKMQEVPLGYGRYGSVYAEALWQKPY